MPCLLLLRVYEAPISNDNIYISNFSNARPPTYKPTLFPTKFPTKTPTSYPTPYPTPLPSLHPDKVWCEAGERWNEDEEICVPCRSGRYNHGLMHYKRDWCYNIPPNEPFMYLNATDVQCRPFWYGIPHYHNGEYEYGCIDCPGGKCPTQSPTYDKTSYQPTILPSYQPTILPSYQPTILPSYQPTILPSSLPSWQPSIMPSASHAEMNSFHPTVSPTEMAVCKIGSCGDICCISLISVLAISASGIIIYFIKKFFHRRPISNSEEDGIVMTQRLPQADSLNEGVTRT